MFRSPSLRDDPRPHLPRRIVPDVLCVAALQIGDPVTDVVLVISNDATRNRIHDRSHARRRAGMCTVTAEPSVRNAVSGVGPRTDAISIG